MAKRTRTNKKKKSGSSIPKYKFRVASGRHHELAEKANGKKEQVTYTIGDTFTSYRRLDKLFGPKLEYLGKVDDDDEGAEVEEDVDTEVDTDDDDDDDSDDDDDEEEVDAEYKVKHKGGGRWIVAAYSTEDGEQVGDPVHDGYLNKTKALELLASLEDK